jgi:hypothetical protein
MAAMPIDVLPDDVLLAIFGFYVKEDQFTQKGMEAWQSLVHVCQRWRSVVFGSPHHLNLRLLCTPKTSRGMLDVWPALPLFIRGYVSRPDMDNIIAVLERSDCVCGIDLHYNSRSQEKVWAAMQQPFPELTHLKLFGTNTDQVIPDSFLGGSAPCLRSLQLDVIPFPGLPKLLLSTTRLVTLRLFNIPHSGYFSPEAIVTALSRTTSLNILSLVFRSPALQSRPDPQSRRSLPPTRIFLPALTNFDFEGASEYLEDLVARIDTPQLRYFRITLFNQFDLDTLQLAQFITRTPTLKAHDEAHVVIEDGAVKVIKGYDQGLLTIKIFFGESDFQLSSLTRVSTSSSPSLSMVESLYIYENQYMELDWEDEIRVENTEWLDLLRPYTAVKNLYLSDVFGPEIIRALQGSVGGRTTVVLPTLQTVFLEGIQPGPVQEDIRQFVAARQLSGYPCAVSPWDGEGRF